MTAARGALVRALRRPWKTIALLTVYPGIDKCPSKAWRRQTGRSGVCTSGNPNLPKKARRAAMSAFTPGLVDVCPITVFSDKLQQIGQKPPIHAKRTPSAFSVLRVPPRTKRSSSRPRGAGHTRSHRPARNPSATDTTAPKPWPSPETNTLAAGDTTTNAAV